MDLSTGALGLPRPPLTDRDEHAAANGLSYLQTRPGNRLFRSSDGGASLAFRPMNGFALVPGHPIGPIGAWGRLLDEFEASCAGVGLAPVFCGVNAGGVAFFQQRDYRALRVGDEAVIDLASVDLVGRRWRECRAALNRARRRGVTFSWVPPGDRAGRLLEELHRVSGEWLAGKPLPELAFVTGSVRDLQDPQSLLAVARDPHGRVEGFVTWTPVPGGGWMLDMMRRRTHAMPGLIDFLVVRSLLWMRAVGCKEASLGGTPLSNVGREAGGLLRRALDVAFQYVRVGYRFRPLWHFKRKFNPRWRPLYLAMPPGVLPSLAFLAIVRAATPGVGVRHLVRAVTGT